eukprot:SAG31_NODE_1401_length_8497_cov_4.386640_7_plen_113_part_00
MARKYATDASDEPSMKEVADAVNRLEAAVKVVTTGPAAAAVSDALLAAAAATSVRGAMDWGRMQRDRREELVALLRAEGDRTIRRKPPVSRLLREMRAQGCKETRRQGWETG